MGGMMQSTESKQTSADCPKTTGVILVDHGSRREESNRLLLDVADAYRRVSPWQIVEPAHMELAEPTIAQAFRRCVEQGARLVVVFPYLLSPGRHWDQDIPRLAAEAAASYPGVGHLVTQPLGLHPAILDIISQRIAESLDALPVAVDSEPHGPAQG